MSNETEFYTEIKDMIGTASSKANYTEALLSSIEDIVTGMSVSGIEDKEIRDGFLNDMNHLICLTTMGLEQIREVVSLTDKAEGSMNGEWIRRLSTKCEVHIHSPGLLNDDEAKLIEKYRKAGKEDKKTIRQLALKLRNTMPKEVIAPA